MTVEAPKPPRKKSSTKGTAPASPPADEVQTKAGHTHQAAPDELVTANFKVDAQFKQDLKMFATMHKMSMVDVLRQGFALLKKAKAGQ
ncbi:hypothetical protein EB795_31750 [Pseudomonas mandelii]|uniref:hypothetical protein n=1 Tax=Pseudomonas mandelii TaxID=75612 RepID=UPI0012B33E4D|nr:hypothetical protein [Pseudomonas mandelii]MSU98440.1 hypothetical protein [Pseudomonas mandelii]